MQKLQLRLIRGLLLGAILFLAPAVTSSPARAANPCMDVAVTYLGRDPVALVNNVQYYRWYYEVCGQGCMNRNLSHWVLGVCSGQGQGLSQISTQSGMGGGMAMYAPSFGQDPTTGLYGLKWNYVSGTLLDGPGKCAQFSFVASGAVTTIPWSAKAATMLMSGTTMGPGCGPVPVAPSSWSAVKAIFRS